MLFYAYIPRRTTYAAKATYITIIRLPLFLPVDLFFRMKPYTTRFAAVRIRASVITVGSATRGLITEAEPRIKSILKTF